MQESRQPTLGPGGDVGRRAYDDGRDGQAPEQAAHQVARALGQQLAVGGRVALLGVEVVDGFDAEQRFKRGHDGDGEGHAVGSRVAQGAEVGERHGADELRQRRHYRQRDAIEAVRHTILSNHMATEADLTVIDERIKAQVQESVEFAENSPYPTPDELYHDVYVQADYPYIRD